MTALVLGSFLVKHGEMSALVGQELYCSSQHKMPHIAQLTVRRPGEGCACIKGWLRPKQGMHLLLIEGSGFAGEQDYRSSGVHGPYYQTAVSGLQQ